MVRESKIMKNACKQEMYSVSFSLKRFEYMREFLYSLPL